MNIEFHYHINLIIARLAGFSEPASEIIAHSAQLVDDNNRALSVSLKAENICYKNIITQTFNIKLAKEKLHDIYTYFHFQPSGHGREKFWIVEANSDLARKIFLSAMATGNPYLIGIASHAFADSFAHHGFIGGCHAHNSPIPGLASYGHMYFGELPDLVAVKWLDIRFGKLIDNNRRFIQAARALLGHYCAHNSIVKCQTACKALQLTKLLKRAFGRSKYYLPDLNLEARVRVRRYRKIYRELGGEDAPQYRPYKWQRQAMHYSLAEKCWVAGCDFENSDWYNFQEQAKNYKALASRSIDEHIEKY